MVSQHSDDFKLSAIKLYLKLNSVRKVAELLNCSKTSLHRWITRYFEMGNVDRKEYSKRKSNLTDKIAKYIVSLIKEKPTITLAKIKKKLLKEHKYDISLSYLFYIVKYKLNLTHKQLRKKYYPEKKLSSFKKDKLDFYKTIVKKGMKNIISIDETGFCLHMMKNHGRSKKCKRCYKTVTTYPFVKFNFICAIKCGKIIGYELHQKNTGGIDAVKFNDFYNKFIKNKYKDYLIILDNAKFHKSKDVISNFEKSGNKILYSLPYNPQLNPIENVFSQLKSHVKNKSPDTYNELKSVIDKIIKEKITKEHLENYYKYLFTQANDFINKNK